MKVRALFVVGLAAALAACGGDDDSGGGTAGSAGTGATGTGGTGTGGTGTGGAGTGGAGTGGSGTGGVGTGGTGTGGAGTGGSGTGGGSSGGIAAKYPGDVGIENDADVVWVENFEEGSVSAVVARYNDAKSSGLSLDTDVPPKSSGKASGAFKAGGGQNATDLFKKLDPGHDELYLRYYAKYQGGVKWHHTGVWLGGYNPASNWPNPQAGLKPNGDDRFSVSLEPVGSGANPRMDFYNYWMKMHSWMDNPSGSTAYYGNTLVHQNALAVQDDQWMCIELHVKLNPDPSSGAGAELGVWMNGTAVQQFTDSAPVGYWIKDKFCPDGADATSCTNYPPPAGTQKIPLDLQYRNTTALKLNAFWPQNYITDQNVGTVKYDDMVIAKKTVGCIQ